MAPRLSLPVTDTFPSEICRMNFSVAFIFGSTLTTICAPSAWPVMEHFAPHTLSKS